MRREVLYLTDIIEAADHIAEFIASIDHDAFMASELIRSAVAQKLAIIGEAASRVSPETRERHRQIPWTQIVAFRNILVHAYFGIDWDEVWNSAALRCPTLRPQIARVLAELDARESPSA